MFGKLGKPSLEVNAVLQSTKEMKKYLFVLDSMTDEAALPAVSKIAKACCKEDKALVHLQLFFHLPYKAELEPVLEDPGDFIFIVPGYYSDVKISPKLYCDAVVEGELLIHFLQLAHHLYDKKFVQDLAEMTVSKFLATESQHDQFSNVMFMLAKISRREGARNGNLNFFMELFKRVLQDFIKHNLMTKYEKLCALFRLAGVCCMKLEDYQASGSDLLELLEEWNFDLTNRMGQDTKRYLSEFYEDKKDSEEPIRVEILSEIEKGINLLQITEEEELDWKEIRKTHRIKWSEFIGVHAYLAKSLLQKYSADFNWTVVVRLVETLDTWAQNRPKLTRDDFGGEIGDFEQFCKVLKRFGEKERDRESLLPKFTEFSYNDVYCSKDGLKIAEKYLLPFGNFDTVTSYILSSMDKDKMPEDVQGSVPKMVKFMIQKLFCINPEMKLRKNEIVPKIFKDGAHSDLILLEFSYHVNNLCSKIGTIEKETKNTAQIEHNRDLVFSTCLEDPLQALMALMRHSISSQHFKALTFAIPFLLIPSGQPSKNPPTIGNLCLENILDNAEEHDQILTSVGDSISSLISNDLMKADDLYEILKKKISDSFVSNVPNLKKISRMYQILNALTNVLTESNKDNQYTLLLEEVLRFAVNSKKFTYAVMPKTSGKEMLYIRTLASRIVTVIVDEGVAPDPLDKLSQEVIGTNFLENKNLIQIGNLYTRIPQLRESIASKLQNPAGELPKLDSELEFASVQHALLTWVHDSASEEWPIILDFVTEVLAKSPSFDHDLAKVLNRNLIFAWNNCVEANAQPMLRQYLKFYHKAVLQLIKKNLVTQENQVQFVDTVVCLVQAMHDSVRKRKTHSDKTVLHITIQQVMLLALEVVNVIIAYNKDFGKALKEEIQDSLILLPVIKGGCEPIRKCLLNRVQNFEEHVNPSLDTGDGVEIKPITPEDVSNLEGILRGTDLSINK